MAFDFLPVFKPTMGEDEISAVAAVIRSGWIGTGPETEKFEAEFGKFIGIKYAIGLNSATAGLHLALILCGIGKGDQVISPSFTFVAVNHAILQVGATPVFADIDEDTLCIDPDDVLKKINKKTKAIIAVHYGGHPVDLDPLIRICKKNNITLIEDCSHSVGAKYKGKMVGSFGDLAIFSFAAIKNIGTPDGGMLTTNNKNLAKRARILRWSGIDKSTWARSKGKYSWMYDVKELGYKYTMNDVSAAIARVQLKKLFQTNLKRKTIAQTYNQSLSKLSWIATSVAKPWAESANHNYWVKVKERDRLVDYLKKNGISTTVHYYPNHLYKLYSKYQTTPLPVTDSVWKKIINLPIFPDLSANQQARVIRVIKNFPQ